MEHTLFNCNAWEPERREVTKQVGTLNPDNLMILLQDEKKRQTVVKYIVSIINEKIAYERRMDKLGRGVLAGSTSIRDPSNDET